MFINLITKARPQGSVKRLSIAERASMFENRNQPINEPPIVRKRSIKKLNDASSKAAPSGEIESSRPVISRKQSTENIESPTPVVVFRKQSTENLKNDSSKSVPDKKIESPAVIFRKQSTENLINASSKSLPLENNEPPTPVVILRKQSAENSNNAPPKSDPIQNDEPQTFVPPRRKNLIEKLNNESSNSNAIEKIESPPKRKNKTQNLTSSEILHEDSNTIHESSVVQNVSNQMQNMSVQEPTKSNLIDDETIDDHHGLISDSIDDAELDDKGQQAGVLEDSTEEKPTQPPPLDESQTSTDNKAEDNKFSINNVSEMLQKNRELLARLKKKL